MITAKYKKEKYQAEITNGKETIMADIPVDKGGGGEYFDPTELLSGALAACFNITARFILDARHVEYRDIITNIDLEEIAGEKTIFKYKIIIDADISEADKDKYIKMILKGCHTHKLLEQKTEFMPM